MKAARHGKPKNLRLLWDCSIKTEDIKQKTQNEDWTPLHIAARLELKCLPSCIKES